MPTTDSNPTTQALGTPLPTTSQNDEFDLGITQASVQEEQVKSPLSTPENLETTDQGGNQTFDFNLDLPETYQDASIQSSDSALQQQDFVAQPLEEETSSVVADSTTKKEEHFLQEGSDEMLLKEDSSSESTTMVSENFSSEQSSDTMDFLKEEPQEEYAALDSKDNIFNAEAAQEMN